MTIFNRLSRRKRGMASNPLFIIPDDLLIGKLPDITVVGKLSLFLQYIIRGITIVWKDW